MDSSSLFGARRLGGIVLTDIFIPLFQEDLGQKAIWLPLKNTTGGKIDRMSTEDRALELCHLLAL